VQVGSRVVAEFLPESERVGSLRDIATFRLVD
jgi:hypothetical protein